MMETNIPNISDIEIGSSDAVQETKEIDFGKYYYDIGNCYSKLRNKRSKFLLEGRKGTGKTMLINYFKLKLESDDVRQNVKIISYDTLAADKLNTLNYDEIKDSEAESFWRYVLLYEFSKMLVTKKEKLFTRKKRKILSNLIEQINSNFESIITETNSSATVGVEHAGILSLNGSLGEKTKVAQKKSKYYANIATLEKNFLNLLKSTKQNYYLILDDLDELDAQASLDHSEHTKKFALLIIGLIKAINSLNNRMFAVNKENDCRIIATLRSDVVDLIQPYGRNINKITGRSGAAIVLSWDSTIINENPVHTELGTMVMHRIKAAVPQYRSIDDKDLFKLLFPLIQDNNDFSNNNSPFNYIVNRTFQRPRDLVLYLNSCKEVFINSEQKNFNLNCVKKGLREYADQFYNELENEISILPNKEELMGIISKIAERKQASFTFDSFFSAYNTNQDMDKGHMQSLFNDLYRLGVLGNSWRTHSHKTGGNKWVPRYEFSYRANGTKEANFTQRFVVHLALRQHFNLN
ncbi:P-loop ATPase, Sll1717 family [Lactiplantibacillus plantarum]|uniref:P-loop ATPase, Sll1717 family n=1 Tax=Lactiplantibacillus plantarum TaxID=1590 RepID=UPI003F529B7E